MRLKEGQTYSQQDNERDRVGLESLGWFKSVAIYATPVGDTQVDLLVDVAEYPIVKEIRIEGNTVYSTADLEKIVLDFQSIGQVWNNRNAQPIVNAIRSKYEQGGYFAEFEQLGPLDESPGTLNIKLLEATVGRITLVGLNRTRESTIRRIMKTEPGEAFNITKFQNDLQELFSTYWFDDIKPRRTVGDSPSVFDFEIEFKEARTAQINAGIALDPQSRIVGTLSYSESNFMGRGQGVGIQLSQATVGGGPSAELAFNNRFFDNKDTSMSVRVFSKVVYNFTGNGIFDDGGGSLTNGDRFDERRTGIALTFNRPVSEKVRATVGMEARNSRTINLTSTTTEGFVQQDGDLLTLKLGAEYSSAIPRAEPVTGQSFSVVLEPGYSNITKIGGNVAQFADTLGTSTFLRSTIGYRQFWSKAPKRKEGDTEIRLEDPRPVLAFKAEYGHISGTVPFFEQHFVGGSNSLRGYANQRFWGSQMLLTSLEYRHPIQRSFSLVGFVDYGGAWGGYGQFSGFEQSQSAKLHLGYGLGLAFRTPLGPIRIDFAYDENGKARTHFSVGTSF